MNPQKVSARALVARQDSNKKDEAHGTRAGRVLTGLGIAPREAFSAPEPYLSRYNTWGMDERAYYNETSTTKPLTLNCPSCRTADTYDLRWLVRTKKDRLPPGADERDRAKFQKWQSYMVLVDDKVMCKNMRCRKRFDISGVKTTAYL